MQKVLYVGLDVHADTIAVAVADEGRGGEVRFWGTIANSSDQIHRLTKKLSADGAWVEFCYEAGPCGYGIQRLLCKLDYNCIVVSPAMIPRKPSDKIKTDRRDAMMLARLLRAGELTAIFTPDEEQEAIRDLIRARKQAADSLKTAKKQLLSFLLRHGMKYSRKYWTKSHWGWLSRQRTFAFPAQQLAFEEMKRAIWHIEERIKTYDAAIDEFGRTWRWFPVVDALKSLRGVSTIIATTLVAEIGDFRRFANPRQLMAWLGLVPSEHSSGNSIKRGRITRTGNVLARTMLVEASWAYRHPPREGRLHFERSQHLPQSIRDKAWKAQTRLNKRYWHLIKQGKPSPRVLTALARELSGFVWDIAKGVMPAV